MNTRAAELCKRLHFQWDFGAFCYPEEVGIKSKILGHLIIKITSKGRRRISTVLTNHAVEDDIDGTEEPQLTLEGDVPASGSLHDHLGVVFLSLAHPGGN